MKFMRKHGKLILALMCTALLVCSLSVTCFAAGTGDVAGAIENTWTAAKGQIKQVVNNVIFPVVDLVLAVLFFIKVGTLYFEYKKHGQFEFTPAAILFGINPGLCFSDHSA